MDTIRIHQVRKLSNADFLLRHARPGRIGLVGGVTPVDRAIRFAQRHLLPDKRSSLWSHALLFEGDRADGEPWVIESDLDFGGGQFRDGVQENRAEKYADRSIYSNLAVLDFRLTERQVRRMLGIALGWVAGRTRYALRGALETYVALLRKRLHEDVKRDLTYCSSFVRTVFREVGMDLAPGVAEGHTLPEHIAQTSMPHTRYLLVRDER